MAEPAPTDTAAMDTTAADEVSTTERERPENQGIYLLAAVSIYLEADC